MYAHATIEDWRNNKTYRPGQEVPDDLPGLDELKEYGSVSDKEYREPPKEAPPVVDVDGKLYIKADQVTRKVADLRAKYDRDEISSDEFDEQLGEIFNVNEVKTGENGQSGEATN
jgi:hypothetical protein